SFQVSSALLFRRDSEEDRKQAQELGIEPIDLVLCNLYPFDQVVRKKGTEEELIENIDIGGPTMIRAAAKNFASVCVCTHPSQYTLLITLLQAHQGAIDLETRKQLAKEAFRLTASYDALIASQLECLWGEELPSIHLSPLHARILRYGENPHQKGWVVENPIYQGLASVIPLQGKALSYNNFLDADIALRCTRELLRLKQTAFPYAVSVIKHLNPCGSALSNHPLKALELAWNGDPISAFGSILGFGFEVDVECAKWLHERFVEIVLAPSFTPEAKEVFSHKKNLRLIEISLHQDFPEWVVRSISGGWVVQTPDIGTDTDFQLKTIHPFPQEHQSLAQFGIIVGKYLRSNAILLVQETSEGMCVLGAGMGNPNRLISLKQAIEKAKENGIQSLAKAVLISDAFFPFPDNIKIADQAGIRFIVQPGGSVKDSEIIQACNESGISMVFTGRRHFIH
ncbi:MAG: bifunctional phosphoribosylaminoimidazolecarboxamide formyltransferase/IMP cyclohydrolase, partial [Planctomycetota bacterium]